MGSALEHSETYRYLESLTREPFNEALRKWKEGGGKIIGCLYNQVPDELITAAGMLALRPRAVGARGDDLADGRFTQVNCSLVRTFYDSAARGTFDFLDGIVAANSCDHVRKLYENWHDVIGLPYGHLICFPKCRGEERSEELARRFGAFKKDFEDHFGVTVTDDDLAAAIDLHDAIREKQAELATLRAADAPALTGTQFMTIMIAGTCMPRDEYLRALDALVAECRQAPGEDGVRVRVVVYGGELDDPAFMEAIESQGALVVGDSLGSFGSRAFDYRVGSEGDLLRNLADALLMRRCGEPRIHGSRVGRWERGGRIVRECRAQGVIQVHIPICDLWSYERMMFDTFAEREGIACLDLDTEYIFSSAGQTRTRVQAFVESIMEGGR